MAAEKQQKGTFQAVHTSEDKDGNVIYLRWGTNETPDAGSSANGGGALFFNHTKSKVALINIYTDQDDPDQPLVRIRADNSSFDEPLLWLRQDGSGPALQIHSGSVLLKDLEVDDIAHSGDLGFFGTAPVSGPVAVAGSRGANAALASLLTALASLGLIVDNTTP